MEGWIKIHRNILDWEWYRDGKMLSLWLCLLLTANHEDRTWRGIDIRRGQRIASLSSLSHQTGLSVQQIRTCLTHLKSTGEITIKSTNRYSIITICKYDTYQCCGGSLQQASQQSTTQSINKQSTTNKNEKNEKRIKEVVLAPLRSSIFEVSSAERASVADDPDRVAELKRQHMSETLQAVKANLLAKERLSMTPEQEERFLCYYCEHNDGNETIKAETYATFSLYDRAKKWVLNDKAREPKRRESVQVTNENEMKILI